MTPQLLSHPRVSGFTIVRNGEQYDYPYLESIKSLLPWVDELIVNVGYGTDATFERIQDLQGLPMGHKLKIFQSNWQLDNPSKQKGGLILSEQTNLALLHCTGDWCLYLQADEVLHEADLPAFQAALARADSITNIEALVFDYLHFYGSYDVIQKSRSAYRREIRCLRSHRGAQSIGDAQSFRKSGNVKLAALSAGARVFHYGWVRNPEAMKEKTYYFDQLYHGQAAAEQSTPYTGDNYRYKRIWGLQRFHGPHPSVMEPRIAKKNWNWRMEQSPLEWRFSDIKKIILDSVEKWTGFRFFEYKNYQMKRNLY